MKHCYGAAKLQPGSTVLPKQWCGRYHHLNHLIVNSLIDDVNDVVTILRRTHFKGKNWKNNHKYLPSCRFRSEFQQIFGTGSGGIKGQAQNDKPLSSPQPIQALKK